ncbi:MAG: RDD family protein [Candidatus Promineifilaceae bacterium]|nr:RDD family protein [Candidatus Promineifilaceae bacterium]
MNTKLNQNQKQTISPLQGQYAGFISRFLAFLIDIIVIVVTVAAVGAMMNFILAFFGLVDVINQLEESVTIQGSILRLITAVWGVTFISFLYFVFSWTITSGKTIGKGLMGLRIVPLRGDRMTLLQSVWRYFAFWLAVLALGIGILWILVSDQRQGWHDKLARTCVIYDWPAREDEGVVQALQQHWHNLKHTRRRIRARRKKQTEAQE